MTSYQILRLIVAIFNGRDRNPAIRRRAKHARHGILFFLTLGAVVAGSAWGASLQPPPVGHTPANAAEECAQLVYRDDLIIAAMRHELDAHDLFTAHKYAMQVRAIQADPAFTFAQRTCPPQLPPPTG